MALEEIVDDGVALIAKGRQHAELRQDLQVLLEGVSEDLVKLLDRHLDDPLTLRREALRLYEEACPQKVATRNLSTDKEDLPHERSHPA